jgi:hypothetical protein
MVILDHLLRQRKLREPDRESGFLELTKLNSQPEN